MRIHTADNQKQEEYMQKKLLAIFLCVALGIFLFAAYAGAIAPGYNDDYNGSGIAIGAGTGINNTVHDLRRHNTDAPYPHGIMEVW